MPHIDTQYQLYVVGDRPFCYWDSDIAQKTASFLESLDPAYFESMANVFIPYIEETQSIEEITFLQRLVERVKSIFATNPNQPECNPQHAALALRMIYSQSLETLFALICGALQAPLCVHAWLLNYRPSELRQLLQNINQRQPFMWQLRASTPSWDAVSDFIHMSLMLDDKVKEASIKKGFSQFWSQLASDFIKQDFTDEYNSIKHGLRVKSGGFSLAIGREDVPGVHAPAERMQLIGKSNYGSSFNVLEKIGKYDFHQQSKRSSRNWSPTDFAWALHLVSTSISNVIACLRVLSGTPADQVKFHWPSDLETLSEPWKRTRKLGVTSMTGFGNNIHPVLIKSFTREEILSNYSAGNYAGVIRRRYNDEEKNAS